MALLTESRPAAAVAAAPSATLRPAQRAALDAYIHALGARRYADAFKLLTSGERRYYPGRRSASFFQELSAKPRQRKPRAPDEKQAAASHTLVASLIEASRTKYAPNWTSTAARARRVKVVAVHITGTPRAGKGV